MCQGNGLLLPQTPPLVMLRSHVEAISFRFYRYPHLFVFIRSMLYRDKHSVWSNTSSLNDDATIMQILHKDKQYTP